MADLATRLSRLGAVALLSVGWAGPSLAQSERAESLPACLTNAGPSGQAFTGFFGTVASPVPYAKITVIGERLELFPDIRSGLYSLIYAYDRSLAPDLFEEEANDMAPIELRFLTLDDAVVHACALTVVGFDPAIQDPATIAFGTCDFDLIEGPPLLLAGQSQRYEMPEELVEVASAPTAVLGVSPQTDRIVRMVGVAPGVGTFMWLRDSRRHDDILMGVCPFTVGDATGN